MTKNVFYSIAKRIVHLVVFYFFFRCLYYAYFFAELSSTPIRRLVTSFYWGLKFDLSAIVIVNSGFFLYWILLGWYNNKKCFDKSVELLFVLVNIIFFSINIIDIPLVPYTTTRMTAGFLLLMKDWLSQGGQLIVHYFFFFVLIFLISWIFYKTKPKLNVQHLNSLTSRLVYSLVSFVFISLLIISIRGGVQYKPLSVNEAFRFESTQLNLMVLNTTYNFIQSIGANKLENKKWLTKTDKFLDLAKSTCEYRLPKDKNIVLFILESFTPEYIDDGKAPFIKSLMQKSLNFKNHYANGTRSIESLPSLFCGIPSLMDEPFLTSSYSQNKVDCFPSYLKKIGYETHFFHGGENGTMFFDSFSSRSGIDHYWGLNEYPKGKNSKDFDGNWGIYDEPYLQYVGKKLDVISEPFFSTIFTLSSHQPYDLPKAYIEVFKEDKLPILKTIEYSDFAVKKFFESNKDKTWFHNTLFIFTADHTQQRRKKENLTYLGQFKVPFFIYTTGGLSSSLNDNHIDQNLTQHSDLKKTLLTSLGIDFGSKPLNNQSSFFCQRKTPILLSLNKKQILSLTDDSALLLDKKTGKVEKVYSLSTNGLTETQINDKSDLVEKTLFYWQSFIDSMINNLNSF